MHVTNILSHFSSVKFLKGVIYHVMQYHNVYDIALIKQRFMQGTLNSGLIRHNAH